MTEGTRNLVETAIDLSKKSGSWKVDQQFKTWKEIRKKPVNYAEYETKVLEEMEQAVTEWNYAERYIKAAFDAGKSIQDAADEVEAQFEEHGGVT